MSSPVVILAPTLCAARHAVAQRMADREQTLVLGNTSGIPRGWREAFRGSEAPASGLLPRFASLGDWFLEAATLAAAPQWSTRADRRFLLRAILPTLRPRLNVLHRLCRSNDLVRQLDLLIADLRHAGHESYAFAGDWSEDLGLIVGEYNRRLREWGATDAECAPAIWAQSRNLFDAPEFECVVFDQVIAPSPVQWRGMNALYSGAKSTFVTLVLPWLESGTQSWEAAIAQADNSALERILWLWRDAGAELEVVPADGLSTSCIASNEASTATMAAPAELAGALANGTSVGGIAVGVTNGVLKAVSESVASGATNGGTPLETYDALYAALNAMPGVGADVVTAEQHEERQSAVRCLLGYRQTPAPSSFDLTAAHTPRDEMERVASSIRAQCDAPGELETRALVLPDAATYAGVLEPTFTAHGVPIRVRRARPHATYPLVMRALRLLQLHESDWNLDEIADLFGDGLLRLCSGDASSSDENNAGENGGTLDIHRLRRACFGVQLDSLRDEGDCLQRLTEKSGEAQALDPALQRDLECIARLRDHAARLFAARDAATWRDEIFATVELTMGHLWDEPGRTPGGAQAIRQAEALLDAVESVAARCERWQPKLRASRNPEESGFADFAFDCLRLELESANAPLEEMGGAALEVISPLQLLSDVPREVYFAGLIEGAWPASGAPGTLLARHQRELAVLRAHQTDPTHLARYQLALAVVEADAVHLSHPTQSGGREVLRSPILEDIALCWQNIPAMPREARPTSRTVLLESLGAWAKAGGRQLVASQLSPPLREALQIAEVSNAQLGTLLRIESERTGAKTLGMYDGALGENGAWLWQQVRVSEGRGEEPLSLNATRLKAYAQCPLRYFVRHVLQLKTPVAWQDELRGDQSGNLVHKILERFGKSFREALTPETQEKAWALLREFTTIEIEKQALRPMLREVEARRLIGNSPIEPGGMLGKMLLAEIAQQGGEEKKPAFAAPLLPLSQASIPLPPSLKQGVELELPLKLGEINIEGRLDRVLISRDGQTLAVIDYKTEWPGGLPRFSQANWGFDFQLPLYLLTVRDQFRTWQQTGEEATAIPHAGIPHLVAAFFALRDGVWLNGFGESGTLGRNQTKTGPGAISHTGGQELEPELFHRWLDAVENRIEQLGATMHRAQFNISIQDAATSGCRFCDFKTACRRDEAVADARLLAAYESRGQREFYLPLPILK